MKIYNTLSGQKEEFIPLNGNKVKMQACGITVSGEAHIGHTYLRYYQKIPYQKGLRRNLRPQLHRRRRQDNREVQRNGYSRRRIRKNDD